MKRQVEDCRKLADSLGWIVAEEYVDNDVSAYSGRVRPAYERMIADLRDGVRDGVIVYRIDRLTRRPVELEEFADTLDAAKVTKVHRVPRAGRPQPSIRPGRSGTRTPRRCLNDRITHSGGPGSALAIRRNTARSSSGQAG